MSHSTFDENADDDDSDDESDSERDEDPDPADQDPSDDEDEDTLPCPFCRKPVYERADLCPHCGNFITFDEPKTNRKLWVRLGIVLALVAAIMACVAVMSV